MVLLALSSPSCRSTRSLQIKATVMLSGFSGALAECLCVENLQAGFVIGMNNTPIIASE